MRGINSVCLGGNVCRDAELKQFDNGAAVLNFTVCVNTSKRNPDGSYEDNPNFIDCSITGNRANALAPVLTKGTYVTLQGSVRQDRWQTQDGQNRSKLKVLVIEIHYDRKLERSAAPAPDFAEEDIPF